MSARPRGYLDTYNPQSATRDLLEQVATVLDEWTAEFRRELVARLPA